MNAKLTATRIDKRRNERGAALVTSLLVSTLLLVIGGALILTSSLAHGLAIDSTAELQAYYSAEAGLNAALNILRGNVASTNPANTLATFRNVADNRNFSAWLTYDTPISGVNTIQVNAAPAMGFTLTVIDPDGKIAPEVPERLLIRSTGYGPKGGKKQMEMMVSRFVFDFNPVATIFMRGAEDGATTMGTFAIGQSEAKQYSGYDQSDPTKSLPVFGLTHGNDLTLAQTTIASSKPDTVSGVDKASQFGNGDLPYWLQDADSARAFVNYLQDRAQTTGRYFNSSPGDMGSEADPKFTFVDGDATLVEGAGLLVVTGKLTSDGNTGFKGIILVLGQGDFERNGTGNADMLGAIVVAKFARTWPSLEDNQAHPFLAPIFNTDGGGTGLTAYSSNAVDRALGANGVRALGVREF